MKLKRNSIIILSLCLLITSSILSQTRTNTPYSIYGVGKINDNSNPINFSMGGIGIAFQDMASLNPLNPASIGSIMPQSFIFDAGLVMSSSKLTAENMSEKASYATINHLLFGFQLMKNWKTSFGLIPFSDVGYGINVYEDRVDLNKEINHIYNGSGGISKAYITNTINVTKNLSIGVETGLYYGEIERSYLQLITDLSHAFYAKESEINTYKDFYWKLGVQYNASINDQLKITIGAILSLNTEVKTESQMLTQLVQKPIAGYTEVIEDIKSLNVSDQTVIPGVFGFGIMIRSKENLKIGLDVEKQFWSNHKAHNVDGGMKNSTRIAIGTEFIPDRNSLFSYYKRMKYRAGIRYEKTPLYINGTQLNEIGISFGIGLPLRRTFSTINFGMEIGQLGKISNNLIKDTFVKFKLGVSMHQKWFEQRKYN